MAGRGTARGTGRGSGRVAGRGRGTLTPSSTASPSTSATPGSAQVTSSPSPYLVVLNPEYHGPPPPPPPPMSPTVLEWVPPPPPEDLTSPPPPTQQDMGSTQDPSEPTISESSHGSQPDPAIQSNAKQRIAPDGMRVACYRFFPKHNNCTNEITSVIKAIPAATRARMFDKWAENFTWEQKHDELVMAIFNTRASKRLSAMMEDVRDRKEHLTQWCRPELEKALYHYWETDEKYLHRQATNKRNRASERCVIYTGGSATPMQTKAKMTKSLDRPVSMAEVFKQTHTLKANKEQFADKRSADIWDEFTNNTTVATQQAAESGTNAEVDPDLVWRQTVSEPSQKNCVFGIGGFLASTLRTSVFAPQSSSVSLTSPAPAGPEEAVDLREQLHESEERIQALHDELTRRPEVHDADVEALKEQLREELRLMQEHRRQMGVTGEQMRAGSSSAAQVPPAHPPAPPEDDDADYVDP
ncbi:hypothetical protein PIB30_094569 [Stylosanthes scabra]|uniref:Uncharacterized protein n=1 Tax=Stylosanthes scabra TaxID=79078 RepID=A0ABU6RVF4_9FABA|nr:hypothetical protein [Stylosanthes scabra]